MAGGARDKIRSLRRAWTDAVATPKPRWMRLRRPRPRPPKPPLYSSGAVLVDPAPKLHLDGHAHLTKPCPSWLPIRSFSSGPGRDLLIPAPFQTPPLPGFSGLPPSLSGRTLPAAAATSGIALYASGSPGHVYLRSLPDLGRCRSSFRLRTAARAMMITLWSKHLPIRCGQTKGAIFLSVPLRTSAVRPLSLARTASFPPNLKATQTPPPLAQVIGLI